MGRAIVYSVLAVLFIAVHSSMAFRSNIHEKMTNAERLAVFGSMDLVPDYEVFPVSLPGARRKRYANEKIYLNLAIGDTNITLNLKPVTRYLASKYTPVWLAQSDTFAYKNIYYHSLPKAMSDVGKFVMYHDVEHGAAVTVYEDLVQGSILDGIFYNYYAIRSLPRRLMGELLTAKGYYLRTPELYKKRSTADTEEDNGYYAVFKSPTAPEDVKSDILAHQDNLRRQTRKVPNAVYPEMLIVIDYSIIGKLQWTLTQTLRFTLAFWNGVDLMYSSLNKPKVNLNIAGIIIAANNMTTPYIATVVSPTQQANADKVLGKMGKYFYHDRDRFPMDRYDMIIAMTAVKLHRLHNGLRRFDSGFTASDSSACPLSRDVFETKTTGNTGIVRYEGGFYEVTMAAEITASLLGAKSDVFNKTAPECPPEGGRIRDNKFCTPRLQKRWSDNSLRNFSHYFSSENAACLHNEPRWINTVYYGEVLPGKWFTLDGQCRNVASAKACQLPGFKPCVELTCLSEEYRGCTRAWSKPLPGTPCGVNKHCSTEHECVYG